MREVDQRKLDEIADDLMDSILVLSRKVHREGHQGGMKFDPSRFVLKKVHHLGTVSMSEIGRHMEISKPYMTALVDKLIAEGLVERIEDPDDRRVVKIRITAAGRNIHKEFTKRAREAVVSRLSSLDSEDIESFHESVKNIRSILSKLDQEKTDKSEQE